MQGRAQQLPPYHFQPPGGSYLPVQSPHWVGPQILWLQDCTLRACPPLVWLLASAVLLSLSFDKSLQLQILLLLAKYTTAATLWFPKAHLPCLWSCYPSTGTFFPLSFYLTNTAPRSLFNISPLHSKAELSLSIPCFHNAIFCYNHLFRCLSLKVYSTLSFFSSSRCSTVLDM